LLLTSVPHYDRVLSSLNKPRKECIMAPRKKSTKIKEFNRPACRILSKAVEAALAPVGKEFGVDFSYKGGNYSPANLTMKIEAAIIGADGQVKSREAEDFKKMAQYYGLEADDLNKEVVLNGRRGKIIGLKPRSRKYPIIVEVENGKMFKYPVNSVLRALGRKVPKSELEVWDV